MTPIEKGFAILTLLLFCGWMAVLWLELELESRKRDKK